MFKFILGYGKSGPCYECSPWGEEDIPDSTWAGATAKGVRGIITEQLPESVQDPGSLSIRELAGLAIRPTYEDLPEETRALVEELLPGVDLINLF